MELFTIYLVVALIPASIIVILYRNYCIHQGKLTEQYIKANAIRITAEIGSEINEQVRKNDNKIRLLYAAQIILCGLTIIVFWWSMGINGLLC